MSRGHNKGREDLLFTKATWPEAWCTMSTPWREPQKHSMKGTPKAWSHSHTAQGKDSFARSHWKLSWHLRKTVSQESQWNFHGSVMWTRNKVDETIGKGYRILQKFWKCSALDSSVVVICSLQKCTVNINNMNILLWKMMQVPANDKIFGDWGKWEKKITKSIVSC